MDVGDLIEHNSVRWVVASRNPLARTVKISRGVLGELKEIADDDPEAKVVANPAKSWPFLSGVTKPRHGRIKSILLTRAKTTYELEFLIDWVPSDFQRPGGPIFFNPSLKLRTGEVLIAVHADDTRTRLDVTKAFASVAARQVRSEAERLPPSFYDHLMSDNDGLDDD